MSFDSRFCSFGRVCLHYQNATSGVEILIQTVKRIDKIEDGLFLHPMYVVHELVQWGIDIRLSNMFAYDLS